MADEIELISDKEGAIVIGGRDPVQRFIKTLDLLAHAKPFDLQILRRTAAAGSKVANTLSHAAEQSAIYIKLTPESAKRLKEAGGLMPTSTQGVSHVMLGETGKKSLKWLQAQDGPASLFTNPAALSGVAGILSQFAQQAEAQQLRQLLLRIDAKLDDVRRGQRDAVLARMKGASASIAEAETIRDHSGDPGTWWSKVNGVSETLFAVQEEALLALQALAATVDGKDKTRELRKVTARLEQDAALQFAVLARCFELQDRFRVLELDYVSGTAPNSLDGHRLGVADARTLRSSTVVEHTSLLMARLDSAGAIANKNILLHARAAESIVGSLNATGTLVDDFHKPLGIESNRDTLCSVTWREAIADPQQRKVAGKEVGRRALTGVVTVGVFLTVPLVTAIIKNGSDPKN